MKKNVIGCAMLLSGLTCAQTPLFHVGNSARFYVEENALVYNGGGVETKGSGLYDIKGNVMVVGILSDAIKTLTIGDTEKTDGGNFILRLNDPTNYTTSTYGQLFITGLSQPNLTAIVDKQYRVAKHGSGNYYQQIALPFYRKQFSTLSTELEKPFGTTRFTQNEILKWNNVKVVSDHFTDLSIITSDPTGYYMLGSRANNFDASSKVFTLKGRPIADDTGMSVILKDAGTNVIFGTSGTATNQYRERYNSYLQDSFDFGNGAWTNNYGKNIYQFGNPFFTNLDLSKIGYVESPTGDGNQLLAIQGIRYDPGAVETLAGGSTFSTGARTQTFVTAPGSSNRGNPVGDLGLIIKPMQTFVIKLTAVANDENNATNNVLNFKTLRRFNNNLRAGSTNYDVTANRNSTAAGTVKQLGIKGLDAAGNEIARAYFVVYPEATSGHTTKTTTQATNASTNLMGTFEEDALNGGYDANYTGQYWLYINEANEYDFAGKAIPFNIYSKEIKSLKFDVLENTVPLEEDEHRLSTGIGFYYKTSTGEHQEIRQNQTIPVTATSYSLFYGTNNVLSSNEGVRPSRTMVVYHPSLDDYVIRFDASWKRATIKVYDMSGRLVHAQNQVKTGSDYPLNLSSEKATYLITAISEQGEIMNTKILR